MNNYELFSALENLENENVRFFAFENALHHIDDALITYRKTGIAQNIRILGESGSGKTTLCKLIKNQYPRKVVKERDHIPVLVVPVPSSATIIGLVQAIFRELEHPVHVRGNVTAITATVIDLLKAVNIEMIVFDEAQHLHERGLTRTHYMVADWLKTVLDAIKVPMVLVGLPNLEKLLQVNEQLRRRFSKKIYLSLGQQQEIPMESECMQLFSSLIDSSPIPFSLQQSSWQDFSQRLYYACDGRVAYLKKLMLGAMRMAMELQLPEITIREFECTFRQLVWLEGERGLNPFHTEFTFRRLDRTSEPFEKDYS